MFILLVIYKSVGVDLELVGVIWNLASSLGRVEGGRVGGALAWLGVRTCFPSCCSHHGPWLFVGIRLVAWTLVFGFVGTS